MDKEEKHEVSLPSASHADSQTILEKQNVIKAVKEVKESGDKVIIVAKKQEEEEEEEDEEELDSEASESDNEEVDVIEVVKKSGDVNIDGEFEKIVSFKFRRLSEESTDEVDDEIAEILHEAEPLGTELKTEIDKGKIEASKKESEIVAQTEEHEKSEFQIVDTSESTPVAEDSENATVDDTKLIETLIDEKLLPKETLEALDENSDDKPPVPIPTYLWEDLKRSKEQGGYPWTHLYKGPLGPNDEPEVILTYNHSPRSGRKAEPSTPKSQKKVRIQDEIEVQETENYINDLSDNEPNDENLAPDEEGEEVDEVTASTSAKSPSKGILKRSQQILENIKPTKSKFDSDSLKRKIKNPLQRIKKMADNQFKKVKSSRIKKIPVTKDEIVLNEELKILKLKESPKSQRREITSYVVKHQDSEDSVEIVNLDESPMEVRRRKEAESHTVTPDEIIELPVVHEEDESKKQVNEPKVKSREASVVKISSKEGTPAGGIKARDHVYEDIEDYISKITSDIEHVERGTFQHEAKLQRQDQVGHLNDPIFDEFSRDMNKRIRKSLSIQDDKFKQEITKKIPKIEDLEKQISDEDREERVEESKIKQPNLLAPISSIDSTSSDEASRAHLSILAEESESDSNKKKSFDDSSVDREIESLKDDGSDISTTLIEAELKALEEIPEKKVNETKKVEESKFTVEKVDETLELQAQKEIQNQEKSTEALVVSDESDVQTSSQEEPKASETNNVKALESSESSEAPEKAPEDDQNVKEDVIVKGEAEVSAPVKVSERWSKMSDHEYEPIGQPMESNENIDGLDQVETQKRKSSDTELGAEKKFLRTPTQDSEDNVSAQDFQNDIESRFFTKEIEPITKEGANAVHQENTFDEAVIIDEEGVKREVPRKRNFMSSAQESGKSFHKKIKAGAGSLKSSLSNKMKKKPKEKPVAVEVAQENNEQSVDMQAEDEPEAIETVHVQSVASSESVPKSKTFKMPKFAKNIKKPTMPTFKKPQFKKPEMPKISMPDKPDFKISERFSNLRKLSRSKSMKEESAATDSTSFTTPEANTADPVKKKFDFGTYPRMIRDKFKRPKLPERADMSMRSDSPTPPEIEFSKPTDQFAQRGPVASRWPEYDQDSGKYQQFNSESDLDRESSIERRMRLDYERSTEEREDFEIVKRLMNEEQRQMDEMERENQEIHLMAQQERYKKPTIEHQESDVGSDEDKMMWSGMLNKDTSKDDFEEETNALRFDDGYKYLDEFKNETDINRSYTPQTNQETQSSGSSGTRRRKGVFDDDDDYFLRENRISNEIHIGDYISSAIKEGLSTPEDNALAQMGGFDDYPTDNKREFTPERPIRSLKRKNKKGSVEEPADDEEEKWARGNLGGFNDFYKTFPPDRPIRKQKKSLCEDEDLGEEIDLSQDHQVPDSYNEADDLINEMNERELFYHQQVLKGLEHPDLIMEKEDYDNDHDYNPSNLPVPPTPPRRRKKKIHSPQPETQKTIVSRFEQRFVPLAQEEHLTPTPPRRTRSRSQVSALTLDDADSFRNDSVEAFAHLDMMDKDNGYAQVRKELPSRPVRRKRSTKSLGDRQFATMPHMKREEVTPPPRPTRNYSTIIPDKPPRRKSAGSLVDISKTIIKDDDYEEILDKNQDINHAVSDRLQSGDIVKRMKDRPLPPPPRPKREHKKQKKEDDDQDDKFDKDDGAEKIIGLLSVDTEGLGNLQDDVEDYTKSSLPRQDSDFSEHEKVIEVEVSTQTDPVLDEDFVCDDDDEDIDIDEFLSSDGKMKTLEDILKEEQEAEMERARQLAEAENLSRGIQRFRDSSQRSMSEKSRTSGGDRSRSLSRPITPSAVLVEQKKSSPIFFQNQEQTLTEAGLFIHPITYDDYGRQPSDDEHLDEPLEINIDLNNNFEPELIDTVDHLSNVVTTNEIQTSTDDLNVSFNVQFTPLPVEEENASKSIEADAVDEDFDAEMQRKIEEMIESVMSSAREEADWIRASNESANEPVEEELARKIEQSLIDEAFASYSEDREPVVEEPCIQIFKKCVVPIIPDDFELPDDLPDEAPPLPPPRRKSNVEETVRNETKTEIESLPAIREDPQTDAQVTEPAKSESQPALIEEQSVVQGGLDSRTNEILRSLTPNRLHLSSLEIDNLSVHSLQAGRITASEIDSNTIVTNEIECTGSHNLSNTKSLEFPPGFIEQIVEQVRAAERAEREVPVQTEMAQQVQQSNGLNEQAPARPPLPSAPSQFGYPDYTSNIPPSFYQLRDPSDQEGQPQQAHRRKKHQTKRKDSTSEEDFQRDQRARHRAGPSSDQSMMSLGGQFARACGNALKESGSHLMEVLRASSKDENKRDLHIALIILIVIVAGLILMGMGDKSVHHHHWDFFNPPDNHGR